MTTMKAITFQKFGPPSVLSVEDVERPVPAGGQALVEVRAAAINPSDVKNVSGGFHAEMPRIPGRDFAGVVIGGAKEWVGKEVWGSGAGLGVTRDGSHAQYLLVPADWLSEKPKHLSVEEASAVGVSYVVAWGALIDAAKIQKGETVMVTGAAGAVGRAATQIAHWMGAKVIGVDRGGKATEADAYINSEHGNLAEETKRVNNNTGVDLVLDVIGGPMFEPALRSLRIGGRQVSIASPTKPRVEFNLMDFYHDQKRLIGVDSMKFSGTDIARIMNQLRDGFDRGYLKPSKVETWPLAKAIEAYESVEKGGRPAKQILLPGGRA